MWYLLTIKKYQVKQYTSEEELLREILYISEATNMLTICKVAEVCPVYQQLHAHVLAFLPKKIYYKKYSRHNNFRFHWQELKGIFNVYAAHSYMHKQIKNKYEQEEIFIRNYFNHHYGFDNDVEAEASAGEIIESKSEASPPK